MTTTVTAAAAPKYRGRCEAPNCDRDRLNSGHYCELHKPVRETPGPARRPWFPGRAKGTAGDPLPALAARSGDDAWRDALGIPCPSDHAPVGEPCWTVGVVGMCRARCDAALGAVR